ncbi:MAG: 16S rRNA (adenine(1518)-N(6)/adenine(1519)-N(6))-dimethyltransferase RsmA [Xylanivirga thermophila]
MGDIFHPIYFFQVSLYAIISCKEARQVEKFTQSLTSPKALNDIISRHGFSFSKTLGQNFLIDRNILDKIIDGANISPGDNVLEVGPGVGTLTRELAGKAKDVVAVEIDKALMPILEETLGDLDNVSIVQGDILKLDLYDLIARYFDDERFKVVANLPYYITTPIIMNFLESGVPVDSIIVMVQKEVAQRMAAQPCSKDYGALTVAVNYYSKPRIITKAPASVFMPKPKVDSMVIALDRREEPPVLVWDKELFFKVIKSAFSMRRKTLLNSLSNLEAYTGLTKDALRSALNACGIDGGRRGETLSIEEFAMVTNSINDILKKD